MDVNLSITHIRRYHESLKLELPEQGRSAFSNKFLRDNPDDVTHKVRKLVDNFNVILAYASESSITASITIEEFTLINKVLEKKSTFER